MDDLFYIHLIPYCPPVVIGIKMCWKPHVDLNRVYTIHKIYLFIFAMAVCNKSSVGIENGKVNKINNPITCLLSSK